MGGGVPQGSAVPGRRRKGANSQAGAAGVASPRKDWWPSERWGYPPASQSLLEPGEDLQSTESLQPFRKPVFPSVHLCLYKRQGQMM